MTSPPITVALLGFVSEIQFSDDSGDYLVKFPTKRNWSTKARANTTALLAKGTREVLLIPWRGARQTSPARRSPRQEIIYESWSGYETSGAYRLNVPKRASFLKPIGGITRIEYTSDKWERAGDKSGTFNLYRHNFKRAPELFANDDKSPDYWAIRSKNTLVTSHGLIG